jgi:hypothetical protein
MQRATDHVGDRVVDLDPIVDNVAFVQLALQVGDVCI